MDTTNPLKRISTSETRENKENMSYILGTNLVSNEQVPPLRLKSP
jgi:hypothetical protein